MTNKIKKIKFMLITIFSCLFMICFVLPNINLSLTKAFSRVMPSILVLDNSDDPKNKNSSFAGDRGKTPFDHDQHISTRAKTTCVTCHHTNSNSLSVAIEEDVPKCTTCHIENDSTCEIKGSNDSKNFTGLVAVSTQSAFHGKTSDIGCIGCHENRGIDPRRCDDCHTGADKVNYVIEPLFPKEKDNLKPVAPPSKAPSTAKVETPEKTTTSDKPANEKPASDKPASDKPASTNDEAKEKKE